MRNSMRMSITVLILTFGLVSIAAAGKMDNNTKQSATDSKTSTQSGTMTGKSKSMMNGSTDGTMMKQEQMMMSDFDKIQKNIGTMMQTNDMTSLKSDLKNLQAMVISMRQDMAKSMPSNMNQMKGKMGSNNMHGQMGSNSMSGMMGMKDQGTKSQTTQSSNH